MSILNLLKMSVPSLSNQLTDDIEYVKTHIRNHLYMSGINRDYLRVKETAEVFTPTELVQKITQLEQLTEEIFTDPSKTFLDPTCGDGQILGEVLIKKMENGSTFEQALGTVYGVDLMIDNVDLCRKRLLCGREDLKHVVEQNIQCRNSLTYRYNFEPMGPGRKRAEEKARNKMRNWHLKLQRAVELAGFEMKKEKREIKLFGEKLSNKKS